MSKRYESTGIIHLKIQEKRKGVVLFVPDKDHCVNHQGKEYAVFLSKGRKAKLRNAVKVIAIKKCLNSVKLKLNNSEMIPALLDTATKRSAVDVKVKCKKDGKKLKLIGITVPALPVK